MEAGHVGWIQMEGWRCQIDHISKLLVESDVQTLKDIQLVDTKIYSFLSVSVCTNADTREWARQGSTGSIIYWYKENQQEIQIIGESCQFVDISIVYSQTCESSMMRIDTRPPLEIGMLFRLFWSSDAWRDTGFAVATILASFRWLKDGVSRSPWVTHIAKGMNWKMYIATWKGRESSLEILTCYKHVITCLIPVNAGDAVFAIVSCQSGLCSKTSNIKNALLPCWATHQLLKRCHYGFAMKMFDASYLAGNLSASLRVVL